MPTKKTTTKSSRKVASKKEEAAVAPVQPKSQRLAFSKKAVFSKRNIIVGVIALVLILAALAFQFRGMFIAATVNGQPISRMQVTQELEKKSGKQVLDNLVTKTLILQEMQKKGITVSDAEVNSQIKSIESQLAAQGRTLNDALLQQGLTRQDLVDQLRIQKMIEKLFAKDITVSNKEIDDYIAKNKDSLPQGQDDKTIRTQVAAQLKQQKLTAKFQGWLSNLQKSAKISYFVSF